ncbi:MAG: ABC transporter substrate-binding protein [Candidatus Binatia bacterium]
MAGCREAAPPPAGLVVAIDSDPQSLDPRFGVDAASSRLADLLHASLTRQDATGNRIPELAAAWEQAGPTAIVFHLRGDFRFADGTPVTADDVRATYEAVLDPATGSPKRGALGVLAGVEAPDPATVVLRLHEPSGPALEVTGLGILPAARAHAREEVALGAGPFRLVSARRGDRIVLAPNPGWPDGPPRIDPLTIRVVPDEVVRVLELERGSVQFVQEALDVELRERLAAEPDLRVRQTPGTSFAYLALNLRDARLADRRVREAVALALDRGELVGQVLGGAARPASGMLAPEHWAFGSAPPPRYDPRRAARLLDRAGLPDPDGAGPLLRLHVVLKTTTQPGRRRLAEAIQADLGVVGIGVEVRSYEWGTLFADIRSGNFAMATLAWVGVGDPDLYYLTLHSTMTPPEGYNRGRYASAVMDRLVERGRHVAAPEARRRIYARVQRRAARELPVVPLWWEDRIVVHTVRLRGFAPEPSGDLRGLARAWLD